MSGSTRIVVLAALGALATAVQPGGVAAQAAVTPPVPVADLGEAAPAIARGDFDAALKALGSGARGKARDARARLLANLGRYDEAERAAETAGLEATRGEIQAARGRLGPAALSFQAALAGPDSVRALVGLGAIAERDGRAADAVAFYERALGSAAALAETDAPLAIAEAARRLGKWRPDLFHDAVRLLEAAAERMPADPEPEVRLGLLFLDKYDSREADRTLRAVLARAPGHPGALLALARVRRFDGSSEAEDLTRRALEAAPEWSPARGFLALLRLEVADFSGARREADRALAADARSAEALGVLVAADLLEGRSGEDRLRAVPRASADRAEALVIAARLASRHHRYEGAAELAATAIEADPRAWGAHGERGLNLLRLGDVDGARRALETAFDGDPFNVWFKNTLDLLDTYGRYETVRTDHFSIFVRNDESELLGPYLSDIAESAYADLSSRYDHEPDSPVRLEVYPEHGDFSVRTVGLPGFGALGVAFGNVLAMNSPSARERGTFNWASTLWHEVAHSVTLGATGNRLPRWFTEGISVREERRAHPGWGRRVSPAFIAAYQAGRMPPVSRLNEGFVRPSFPGQIGLSYLMASLAVEWIEDTHGFGAVREMLAGYGRGWSEERVFEEVLDATPEQVDEAFDAHLRAEFAGRFAAIGDGEKPGPFADALRAGAQALGEGRIDAARARLDEAARLFPEAGGNAGPHALLARLHREAGDGAAEEAALTSWTAIDETAYDGLLRLAELRRSRKAHAAAAEALQRALWIYPFEPAVHVELAELHEAVGDFAAAARERRAVLALAPTDLAGAWYRLAEALRRAGDAEGARDAVLRSLEIAPRYEEALDLLLDLQG